MYSYEERMAAIKQLEENQFRYTTTIYELGYPKSTQALRNWYKEYRTKNGLHHGDDTQRKYTKEQRTAAIKFYLENGGKITKTVKAMGYPSRQAFHQWLKEELPDTYHPCQKHISSVYLSQSQKDQAVIELCTKAGKGTDIAAKYGTSREVLYHWKKKLLTKEIPKPMATKVPDIKSCEEAEAMISKLKSEVAELTALTEELKKQVYRLNLEKSILETAAEVIKKDQGISIQTLTNREKAIIINAQREYFPLKDLLQSLQIAKSSYCYQAVALKTDRYCEIRETVRNVFEGAKGRYGYRRIHAMIRSAGKRISEKVVRRLMREQGLSVHKVKKRKYNSYQGEITPAVENVINRNFHAEKPNEKWLTDITEFHIPAGKVYLSPIIDCFDGMPVSWTIGKTPDADLVNSMLDKAVLTLKDIEKPVIHSDRGAHYRWPGWIERMEAAGLTRSMSKKGCSPDNSACEGFFGRLKNEMFYGVSWLGTSIDSFINELDQYIKWYANDRIKLSLGGLSPMEYRRGLGLLAT